MNSPQRIFISYSHDSETQRERVRELADTLVEWGGLQVELDLWNSHPPEGWTAWMEQQIRLADYVLIVCSAGYQAKINQQGEAGIGKGVKWEGRIIRNLLYQSGAVSAKFVPILLGEATEAHLLTPLADATHYRADTPEGFEALYRYLSGQPKYLRPTPKAGFRKLPSQGKADARPSLPEAEKKPGLSPALRQQLKMQVAQGKTRAALTTLLQQDLPDLNAVLGLQARLQRLQGDEIKGILSSDEATRRHNQINHDFLQLLDLL